jgi:hypothetical protein
LQRRLLQSGTTRTVDRLIPRDAEAVSFKPGRSGPYGRPGASGGWLITDLIRFPFQALGVPAGSVRQGLAAPDVSGVCRRAAQCVHQTVDASRGSCGAGVMIDVVRHGSLVTLALSGAIDPSQ